MELFNDIFTGDEAKEKLLVGVRTMASAVKSTLGAAGNTVLIESPNQTHGITVTKDGVTVAKSISLIDPVENLAVKMMKEAAEKTASSAGDGTTTAIVLTEALVENGFKAIRGGKVNRTDILRSLSKHTDFVLKGLDDMAVKVSDDNLLNVATISANNDKEIGKVVSDVYKLVGINGFVTVEKSKTSSTHTDATSGIKIDRGYSSPSFVNNHRKDECVLDDVAILVSDSEITNILQIENVLKPIISERKSLLIIAPCTNNVINTFAANVVKNGLKLCVIQPPSFGYKQNELMSDIAVGVGAKYFSEKIGDDLSLISISDLGHASKVVVSKDATIIADGDGDQNEIDTRVKELAAAKELATKKAEIDFISTRIASITGGIGVIYVGGNTDLEQKELFDRVDDAVCAVRSAIEEGIVPGGGIALRDMSNILRESVHTVSEEDEIAKEILMLSMYAPFDQILKNAWLDPTDYCDILEIGVGLDIKSMKGGSMVDMGIIDPVKVTKNALTNAVSVANTILSTNSIITIARES